MTAITLTAPAQGTAAAPAAGKAASDAGAGFASLLALLAAPAADTQAGLGQQDTGEEAAVPTDGQQATPTAVQPGLPQLSLPAPTAPQAQAAVPAAVPAAPGPAQALPAPGQTVPTTPLQPAPAAVQEQPVVAVLSGQVPVAPLAQEQAPARPSAVKDEQEPEEPAAAPAAPAVETQIVPVQLPVLAAPATAAPAKQDQGAPAASGQGITFTGPGVAAAPAAIPSGVPVGAPATALPAVPVSSLAGTVAPAPAVAQSAVAPDAPAAPVSDSAAAFGQVAAAAAPSQPAPPAAPAPPVVPVPRGYTAQLARPLFTIAAAGPGQHTMTVEVNPQNLGPVTLQAHSGADGIRIEMFAATSDGRDALRQALPELKKDLAGAGINASLDLSSGGQGSAQGGQDRETFTRRFQTANQTPVGGRPLEVKAQNTPTRPGLYGPETTLDVLA